MVRSHRLGRPALRSAFAIDQRVQPLSRLARIVQTIRTGVEGDEQPVDQALERIAFGPV